MNHNCESCHTDISHRKHNARFCEPCGIEFTAERAKARMKATRAKAKAQMVASAPQRTTAAKNAVSGFQSIGKSPRKPDLARLATSRAKGGQGTLGGIVAARNAVEARQRTATEIKLEIEREYAMRRQAALLPAKLRAGGRTVNVRVSSEGMKHLDKQSRRDYERGTKSGFKVLPEARHYSLAQRDKLVNYVGFVVR